MWRSLRKRLEFPEEWRDDYPLFEEQVPGHMIFGRFLRRDRNLPHGFGNSYWGYRMEAVERRLDLILTVLGVENTNDRVLREYLRRNFAMKPLLERLWSVFSEDREENVLVCEWTPVGK